MGGLPAPLTIEERQAKADEKRKSQASSIRTYASTVKRWDKFAEQYPEDKRREIRYNWINNDGSISSQFDATAIRFIEFLRRDDNMSHSVLSTCLNWLAYELNEQLALKGKSAMRGYCRRLPGVAEIIQRFDALKFNPMTTDEISGVTTYKDILSQVDNPIDSEQKEKMVCLCLNNRLRGAGPLANINTLYELLGTHITAARGEDFRHEMMAFSFVRDVPSVGKGGCTGLFVFTNKGKQNKKGRSVYSGMIPHTNPIFDGIGPKGLIFMMRFNSFYGQAEPVVDFADPKDCYERPVVRSASSYRKGQSYASQYKNFSAAYEAIGYTSSKKTHGGRSASQPEMTAGGMTPDERNQFCRLKQGISEQSYDLQVPPKGLVQRAGGDCNNLRSYNAAWYLPVEEWPEGMEDELLQMAAPWIPQQQTAIDAAFEQYKTYSERTERCLFTGRGSLKAVRHCIVVSLCWAAARPLGKNNKLIANSKIICELFSHPVFAAEVYRSERFKELTALVRERQDDYEAERNGDNRPLTVATFRREMDRRQRASTPNSDVAGGADAMALGATAGTGTATAAPPPLPPANEQLIPPSAPPPGKPTRSNHATAAAAYARRKDWTGPFYVQNSDLDSISDIWREYKYGLNGSISIFELELKHKGWRGYKAGYNAFDRRKAIWATIEKRMSEDGGGLTEQAAVASVQQQLDAFPLQGKSKSPDITAFNKKLKDEEFGGDKFELEVQRLIREQRGNNRKRGRAVVEDV